MAEREIGTTETLVRFDSRLAVLFRRDLLDVCLVIFLADVVAGMIAPTFSLYALSLGASLSFLGILAAAVGVVRLALAIPLGVLSDWNRKWVLVSGMVIFLVAALGFALAPGAVWLLTPNALFGIAQIATFTVGIAYLGDHLPTQQRGLGISLYTTAMGLGFGIGPAVGGWLQQESGFPFSYTVAAAVAAVGAAYGAWRLKADATLPRGGRRMLNGATVRVLLSNRHIWAACLGQIVMSLTFSGAIVTFLPVLAKESLGLTAATVGGIFAIRAFASTALRLPAGLIELAVPTRYLMIAALVIEAATLIGLQATRSVLMLVIVLAIEGISFGMFLTTGQEFVTQLAPPNTRGAAMGIYSMAGSLGQSCGAFALGFVAQLFGIRWVFLGVAAAAMLGAAGMVSLSSRPLNSSDVR